MAINVLGTPLKPCSTDPMTGYFRDGCCATRGEEGVAHLVCVRVTAEFLEHQRSIGNDLVTPMPEYRFPGLVPGDRWCVCASRWLELVEQGVPSPVVLAATHERSLEEIPLALLEQHATA